ncbi:MAG TPA: hypothetical protein VFN22_05005 [Gemmatimonadales bacterium]|nr:hypothetical protein [Gemmatimonadales bacterium]
MVDTLDLEQPEQIPAGLRPERLIDLQGHSGQSPFIDYRESVEAAENSPDQHCGLIYRYVGFGCG